MKISLKELKTIIKNVLEESYKQSKETNSVEEAIKYLNNIYSDSDSNLNKFLTQTNRDLPYEPFFDIPILLRLSVFEGKPKKFKKHYKEKYRSLESFKKILENFINKVNELSLTKSYQPATAFKETMVFENLNNLSNWLNINFKTNPQQFRGEN
jgi:hypothetical protein